MSFLIGWVPAVSKKNLKISAEHTKIKNFVLKSDLYEFLLLLPLHLFEDIGLSTRDYEPPEVIKL